MLQYNRKNSKKRRKVMANKGIYLDYDGLATASQKLRTEKENFDAAIKSMAEIVNALPEVWEGETSMKYIDQFADLTPGFEATRDLIEEIAAQMDSIVATVQDTDSGMASQVGVK